MDATAKPAPAALDAWTHHLQDEADAAFLYGALAAAEGEEARRAVYLRLADAGGGFFHYAALTIEPNRLVFREWGDDAAQAVVLLATDLPTFACIETLEKESGLPVLTSNQCILWRALGAVGNKARIQGLGRLFAV